MQTLAGPVAVPVSTGAVPLDVVLYDDRVRATIGSVTIEGALGTIRDGRLALVARGGGRFSRLLVEGLDAWRFHAQTSGYDDFPAHVQSFTGVLGAIGPGELGTPVSTVADLAAGTAPDIAAAMTSRSDAEPRQRLFETWTTSLGLPLREHPAGLSLTRWEEGAVTTLILLESDEPLPFSQDVTLTLAKPAPPPSMVAGGVPHDPPDAADIAWTPVPTLVLTNGDETRALIVPGEPLGPGSYELSLAIDRARWRAAVPDAASNYRASSALEVTWIGSTAP